MIECKLGTSVQSSVSLKANLCSSEWEIGSERGQEETCLFDAGQCCLWQAPKTIACNCLEASLLRSLFKNLAGIVLC